MPKDIPKYLITGNIKVNSSYRFDGVFQKPYEDNEIFPVLQAILNKKK